MKSKILLAPMLATIAMVAPAAYGQNMPSLAFTGTVGSNQMDAETGNSGTFIVTAPDFGSFHGMKFSFKGAAPGSIGIKYDCIYAFGPNSDLYETKGREDGQMCPKAGGNFVRAIRLELTGADSDEFSISSQCIMGYFGQKRSDALPPVPEGELCGHPIGQGAALEWITQLIVTLRKL